MSIRSSLVIALLTLSSAIGAQGVRLPRIGRQPTQEPVALPPEAPVVARSLAFQRSRWSSEGYSLITAVQVPVPGGGVSRYNTFGTGTHADYRYTEQLSATLDLTVSPIGSSSISETVEAGTRFSPLSWDRQVRPFVDVRAAFMHLYDTFIVPAQDILGSASNQAQSTAGRYSRGLGGVGGAGLEYSLTPRFSLTTEVSALRSRMTVYRLTAEPNVTGGNSYWLTSFRYTLGLKFTPVRALH